MLTLAHLEEVIIAGIDDEGSLLCIPLGTFAVSEGNSCEVMEITAWPLFPK